MNFDLKLTSRTASLFAGVLIAVLGVFAVLTTRSGDASAGRIAHAAGRRHDPLAVERFYVRRGTSADSTEAYYRSHGETHDANLMARIADRPEAIWLTGSSGDLSSLSYTVNAARRSHREVTVVLYNLPGRDCGSYSSGGVGSASAYRGWINSVAARLGSTPAVVVVEPDALPEETCWSSSERSSNVSLIRYAVEKVGARPRTYVYIDAGNPVWQPASVMAQRLKDAGISHAEGFSVDTASFESPKESLRYARAISRRVGAKHFVIDTSRDGRGPLMVGGNVEWCNPPGRGLGPAPTTNTHHPRLDAYLWLKVPGESDGPCNGGPTSGVFWPAYALGLAARAS